MAKRFSLRFCALSLAVHACYAGIPLLLPTPGIAAQGNQQTSIRTLSNKGIYWYERYRFDLAVQSFNKILLLDPSNASALRWQGLIDLARGDIQAANVWLGKLQMLHGNHPFAIELQQSIALAGEKRQPFAELRYLAVSEQVPVDLPQRLRQLLPQAPLGDAAVQIYRLMNRTTEGREYAKKQTLALMQQFPEDLRYTKLLAELGGITKPATRKTAPRTTPKPPINAAVIEPSRSAK